MLRTETLSCRLGRSLILSDVSARFAAGRFTALVGANGSGKSTLLRCLMGIVTPETGGVLLDDRPVAGMRRRDLARRMSYLPQANLCPDHMTVGELVELAGFGRTGLFGAVSGAERETFHHALQTVGLEGAERHRVSQLSGGQRQRAFIAMVLAQDTPLLLMDEPVNHLDLRYQYAVLDLVRSLVTDHGKTLVMVLHDLNLALAYADDVVLLKEGRVLAQGPAREVLDAPRVAEGFGIETRMRDIEGRTVCLPRGARMVGLP